MNKLARFLLVFAGLFAVHAEAQITTTFSGTIDSGLFETFPPPEPLGPPPTTPTLSVDLAGAPYVIELTYSGDLEPVTDGETFADWSGTLSANYFIYSPASTSELVVSGQLSPGAGSVNLTNAVVTVTQETIEVEGSSPTVTTTIDVENVSGTDAISWALNTLEGSLSIQFVDDNHAMVEDVNTYPSAPASFTSSAISLTVDNDTLGGGDMTLSMLSSEQGLVINGDLDGDGIPDAEDDFPGDAGESIDSDGDGVGDNADKFDTDPLRWSDDDGDGYSDQVIPPAEFPEDGFPEDETRWLDEDGDGASEHDFTDDGIDNPEDAFPDDPLRWSDLDGDGFSDQVIPPSEFPEDMFPNDPDEYLDSDFDGYGDDSDKCVNSNTDVNAPVALDLEGLDIDLTNRHLARGCWLADAVEILINRANKGNSGVALATNYLVAAGDITGRQKGEIVSAAAKKIEDRENGNGNGNGNAGGNGGGNGNDNAKGNGNANSNAGNNGNGGGSDNSNAGGNGGGSDNSNAGGNGGGSDNNNAGGGGNDNNNTGDNGGGSDNNNAGGNGGGNDNTNAGGNGGGGDNNNAGGNGGGSDNNNAGGNGGGKQR